MRARVARAMLRWRRRLMPPQMAVMELSLGIWPALALRAVVRTGIMDRLSHSSATPAMLARDLKLDAGSIRRVLRMLAGYDVVRELTDGGFELTRIGRAAAGRTPESAAAFIEYAGESWQLKPWQHLDDTLRTGEPAFKRIYGSGFFDYLREHTDAAELFDSAMSSVSALHADAVVAAYDFRSAQIVADIGGGKGLLLARILQAHPSARGVLFDLPHALAAASDVLSSVRDRTEIVEGNFFDAIAVDADIFMLAHILHDWDDEAALKILQNVAARMSPRSRMLIVETVLESELNGFDPGRLIDVQMLTILGGRERTLDEYRALLGAAGLKLRRRIATSARESILEAARS